MNAEIIGEINRTCEAVAQKWLLGVVGNPTSTELRGHLRGGRRP